MEADNLPEDVVRFVFEQIDTVPHLEALLLMWETAPRPWSEEQIAARVYVSTDVARRLLQDLHRRRLIAPAAESPGSFAYDGAWDPDGKFMDHLSLTYRRHLVRVATLIHSKASAAVRDFARAFRFNSGE